MSLNELFIAINALEANSTHIDSAIKKIKDEEKEEHSSSNEKNVLARTYSL
ncbi:hypothetical protein [Photobacterium iliopiscarium]|uniref:hypothetical protein n=1 Tax=Photobacterium iliopiscarium TaxID=56192 RepID=UPI0015E6B4A3|nr:hypothetical protein [Photobacterium iliopiscarium]